MYEGICLAGGTSARFNCNKMCALFNEQPLIMHAIQTMSKICHRVVVVTGHYHDEIKACLKDMSFVDIVYNPNYDQGMFSSVRAGASQMNHDFFIIPGDYPLVKLATYKKLASGLKSIRVPSFSQHLGHPIFIKKELAKDLIDTNFSNLKEFRNAHDFEIINVDDEYILKDIDSINDLNNLLERND